MESDVCELFLFRHGMTLANEKKLYCGKTDLNLCEKGRRALEKKRGSKKYPDISHCKVFTSGMKRAKESLAILYPNLSDSAETETNFSEIDFGDFEMKSYEDLKSFEIYRGWAKKMLDGVEEFPCPNGESFAKMKNRVFFALERILKNHRHIAIFTHGGVISVIMGHFFKTETKNFYDWQPDFGCGYKIVLKFSPKLKGGEGDFVSLCYEAIP